MQKTGGSCSGADDVLEAIVHGDSRVLHGGCGVRDYEVIDVGTVDGWQAELSTSEIGEAVFAAKGDVLGDERLRTCADEAATEVRHVCRHSRFGERPSDAELVAHQDLGVAAGDEEQRAWRGKVAGARSNRPTVVHAELGAGLQGRAGRAHPERGSSIIEIDVGDSADDPPRSELVVVAAIELQESTGSAKAIK